MFIFDFDGTLAHRPGMWTRCLHEVLEEHRPGHGITLEDLRPHLGHAFPWHRHETAHPELADPEDWWDALGPMIDRIYHEVGIKSDGATDLRAAVRRHYCDPTRFQLYPDTIEALELLRSAGVRASILSNHVPELDQIVKHHGIDGYFDEVLTSAVIGFEKPHPAAFKIALRTVKPARGRMIGDNPIADKRGAEGVGMPGILVRHPDAPFETVLQAVEATLGGS